MGLIDMIEQAAGLCGQPGQPGGNEGAAAPSVGGTGGAIGAVLQMLQAQPGGVGGVLQKFESAGLGGVAQSWMSAGQNQSVSPDQVQGALGQGAVGQVASQMGVPPDQAAGHIAQFLPMIMDHLSPNGQTPNGGGLGEIEGLLSRFGGSHA